jgi:hypothetical protein
MIDQKDDYLYFLKRSVDLFVRLHKLIKKGKDESDEGEKIREECDQYWNLLSEEDQEWLRSLSANLYALVETAGPLPPTISNEEMLRRAKEKGGRSTKEILDDLNKKYKNNPPANQ